MKSDKLQDAIGEVKDEYIADAHPEAAAPQKKNRRIFRSRRKLSCAKARPQAARPPRVRCF